MSIIFALILSVVCQIIAAYISLRLIKLTRYNISWIFISIAFLLMAIRRIMELLYYFRSDVSIIESTISTWTAVVISIFVLLGVIYIKRIFILQRKMDDLTRVNESKILSTIIGTEENERQQFARELHDGLAPLISSIKMSLSVLSTDEKDADYLKNYMNMNLLIDEALATIKEISNRLSPHILSNFGLLRALKSFIEKLESPSALHFIVNANIDNKRFDHDIEFVLYRVIIELINNTILHAEASNVSIDLTENEKELSILYTDDGIGFNYSKVLNLDTGMGLANIRTRIKSIRGTMDIESSPGEGVRIKIVINTGTNG